MTTTNNLNATPRFRAAVGLIGAMVTGVLSMSTYALAMMLVITVITFLFPLKPTTRLRVVLGCITSAIVAIITVYGGRTLGVHLT